MRIVIDTNIWISGLLWRGTPCLILQLAAQGEIELCMAPEMLEELYRVLAYERFQPRLDRLGLTPSGLVAYAMNLASIFDVLEGDPIVLADPDDNIFLYCALTAGADYVVSGDRHMLDLGTYEHISILTASDFLDREFPNV
jgi:putative PIN family toxin of toxin-antitoxin system